MRRGRQFQFFPAESDSFKMLAKSQFHETVQKLQHFSKKGHKNCHFYRQFHVKLTKKKKRNQFPVKTGARDCQCRFYFETGAGACDSAGVCMILKQV